MPTPNIGSISSAIETLGEVVEALGEEAEEAEGVLDTVAIRVALDLSFMAKQHLEGLRHRLQDEIEAANRYRALFAAPHSDDIAF